MSKAKAKVTPKEVSGEADVSSSLNSTKRDLLTKSKNATTNTTCANTTATASTKATAATTATTAAKTGAVVAGKAGFLAGMTTVKLIIVIATVMGCTAIIVGVSVGVGSNKNRDKEPSIL